MSKLLLDLAEWRWSRNKPYPHGDIETSELRKDIGLKWYLGYEDEDLTSFQLGEHIDDCLLEAISDALRQYELGLVGVEDLHQAFLLLEEGMQEDPDLKAYAEGLPVVEKDPNIRPASEIFLEWARRHAVDGEEPPEDPDEACKLASAILVRVKYGGWAGYDWDIKEYSQFCADVWRHERDPYEIRLLIFWSQWNAADWDTLVKICEDTARDGIEAISQLPPILLQWFLAATFKNIKRPTVPRAPRGPRKTHGTQRRNIEIRHTVNLLGQVNVSPPDAHFAVGKALGLEEDTVRNICGNPDWTLEDFRLDAERRGGTPIQALFPESSTDSKPPTPS